MSPPRKPMSDAELERVYGAVATTTDRGPLDGLSAEDLFALAAIKRNGWNPTQLSPESRAALAAADGLEPEDIDELARERRHAELAYAPSWQELEEMRLKAQADPEAEAILRRRNAEVFRVDPEREAEERVVARLEAESGKQAEREIDQHEQRVELHLNRLRALDEATRRFALEQGLVAERPKFVSLRDFLAVPDPEIVYRIDRILPIGGRVVLAAPKKLGKSTFGGNLIRSLVDGDPFLGAYEVQPVGCLALIDDEHDEVTLRRWLRDQGIRNDDRVVLVSLRGRVSSLDLLDPKRRGEWAADLKALGVQFVLLDCLRPVIDALGLEENRDAGRVLSAFDLLLGEAGVREGAVWHHMGHTAERSRGDSRIRDWPDVEWRMVQQQPKDGTEEPDAPRYFAAYGRDVNVSEAKLEYDPMTRHLKLVGGNRRDSALSEAKELVLERLCSVDRMPLAEQAKHRSFRALRDAAYTDGDERLAKNVVEEAIHKLVADGEVRTDPETPVKGQTVLHHLAVSQVSQEGLGHSKRGVYQPGTLSEASTDRERAVGTPETVSPQSVPTPIGVDTRDTSPTASPDDWLREEPF